MTSVEYLKWLEFVLPETILAAAALAVLFIDRLALRDQSPNVRNLLGSMFGIFACLFSIFWMSQSTVRGVLGPGIVHLTSVTILAKQLIVILAIGALALACESKFTPHLGEFLSLLLLSTTGLMFLVSAENLLMIFLCLELATLPLYILACFDKTDKRAAESALKYFLFGSLAAAFTVYGMSMLYGYAGTLVLSDVALKLRSVAPEPMLLVGVTMTLAGFAFKIAAAPFHLWAPDVYQTAPLSAAAMIAAGSKLGSFVVLTQFTAVALAPHSGKASWEAWFPGSTPVLAILAGSSMIIGNLVALRQTSVRRLLAYSAVAHAGYMVVVLAGNPAGAMAPVLFYAFTYGLTIIGAFAVVSVVQNQNGSSDDAMGAFDGLSGRSPTLALCLLIFLLSLAGIPPLAGFFGKFYVFGEALRSKPALDLLWLVVLAIGMSAVSLYYYLLVLKHVYVFSAGADTPRLHIPIILRCTILLLAAAVLVLGIAPGLVLNQIPGGH